MDKQILDLLLTLLTQFRAETTDVVGEPDPMPASDQIALLLDQVRGASERPAGERRESGGFRVLHVSERDLFRSEAHGLLLELWSLGLIGASELEELIDYARLIATEPLSRESVLALLPDLYAGSRTARGDGRGNPALYRTVH